MTFDPKRPTGPNVRKLIFTKMANDAVPAGQGFQAAIEFLTNKAIIQAGFRTAAEWVFDAIDIVKAAPGNTFPDDEAIAGEILRQIEARKRNV